MVITMAARALAFALVVAALLSGCTPEGRKINDINDSPNAGTVEQQYATLAQRPDIDEATRVWLQLLDELKRLTVTEFALPEWLSTPGDPVSGAGCGFDFPDIGGDGATRQINGGYSNAPITDDKWDQAVDKVGEIAKRYGFTRHERMIDRPGNHDVTYFHPDGTKVLFGTELNTVLTLISGCYLTAEAKRRGAPTSPTLTLPPDLTEPN